MEFKRLKKTLNTDKHCIVKGNVHIITNLHTYEKTFINLNAITEDVFNKLSISEDELEELFL